VAIAATLGGSEGNLTIDTTAGTVVSGNQGINATLNGSGVLTIVAGDVTATNQGISATSSGSLFIDSTAGTVTSTGGRDAIVSFNLVGEGETSITTADVTSVGDTAILVFDSTGDVTIDTTAGSVTGAEGIVAIAAGSNSLSVTTADVVGDTDAGVVAVSNSPGGDVFVDTTAGTVTGATEGIVFVNNGAGSATLHSGDVTGYGGYGAIFGRAVGSSLTIDTSAGTVTGSEGGIVAYNEGTGPTSIVVNDVTGTNARGIFADNSVTDTAIRVQGSSGDVTGGTDGIYLRTIGGEITAENLDSVTGQAGNGLDLASEGGLITVNSVGTITGMTGNGILADAGSGDVSIQGVGLVGGVTGTGDFGISASGGTVDIGGSTVIGDVSGTLAGISVVSTDPGDVIINTSAGTATGGTNGIIASAVGEGDVSITAADVSSSAGIGIFGESLGGGITIDALAGAVTGANAGIAAMQMGTGDLTIAAANVTAVAGNAIHAVTGADGGSVAVDSSAGTAMGSTNGVYVQHAGSGDLVIAAGDAIGGLNGILTQHTGAGGQTIGVQNATGMTGSGVAASSDGDGLSISVTGMAYGLVSGVDARHEGSGNLEITVVDAVGANDSGIFARNSSNSMAGADLIINSTGTVEGETGIDAENNGTGDTVIIAVDVTGVDGVALDVSNGEGAGDVSLALTGTVVGNEAAIVVDNAGTGATTITTSGMIAATSGEAIRVTGAGANVTNSGAVVGFVNFGDGDDAFINDGDFGAGGDSAFGGGSNSFVNNGLFAVTSTGPVAFTGLGSFTNTGMLSLVDGQIGNNLVLSGDFNGTGSSMLGIDLSFADELADVLTIEGAATGSTIVGINALAAPSSLMFSDILIVDAGEGSEAGAFALEGGRQSIGLLNFEVAFDAALNDYFIVSALAEEGLQTTNFAEGVRNLAAQSFDTWSSQLASLRAGTGTGVSNLSGNGDNMTRVWFTASASDVSRDRVETFTSGMSTTVVDLSYDQDFFGFQGGVDFGNEVLRYGLTGGYLSSQYSFVSSSDRINYNVFNVGAYVALDTGPFFANALVKYDTIDGDIQGGSGVLDGDADGSTFGARVEVGALIGDHSDLFLEPSFALSWTNTSLDDLTTVQGDFAFDEDTSLIGRFGARVGKGFDLNDTGAFVYLGGFYISEFQGEDTVGFSSNGSSEQFTARPFGDFGEARAGIAIGDDDSKISGGFEGHVLFGDDFEGFGGSVNLRFRF
jgi:outer membrane autotransporter protein